MEQTKERSQADVFKTQLIDAINKTTSLYELNAVLDKFHRRGIDLYMDKRR